MRPTRVNALLAQLSIGWRFPRITRRSRESERVAHSVLDWLAFPADHSAVACERLFYLLDDRLVIAQGEWDSRLPCENRTDKKRSMLFSRKEQKAMNRARRMRGVPDLSLEVEADEESGAGPMNILDMFNLDGSDPSNQPAKKKRRKKKESTGISVEKSAQESTDGGHDSESDGVPTLRDESGVLPHAEETTAVDRVNDESLPDLPTDPVDPSSNSLSKGNSGKKKEVRVTLGSVAAPLSDVAPSIPDLETSPTSVDRPITRRFKTVFPDKVSFSYDEASPLISNGPKCAELVGQIRGGPCSLPLADQLVFSNAYKDASRNFLTAEGSFNFLVEKYDSELKRAYADSGEASEKIKDGKKRIKSLKTCLKRVKAEKDEATRGAENEAMRAEDISSRFESMRAAAAKVEEQKAVLLADKARLEREKLELVEAHAKEADRLRESRVFEVTRERARVTAVMCAKAYVRYERIRNRENSFPQFDNARRGLTTSSARKSTGLR
ncbi:unnamed protein product [Eruca vesicaria subsp. sativa]|uniref:Uncharacterized protein n=1 Tax=Eruca vesicaria subsp. sativa TaxID=29727 RepID=A0ABC8J4F8_ERUVS|nr:unnamed protein product [Eruca vesicaria subsp. sativa]